ncbi:unnamed protein product, partial [Polarella glacialis]
DAHWKNCWMDDDDLDELYEDVVDQLQGSLKQPDLDPALRERLESCTRAMRELGDSYCKELWAKEDKGERYRRREEEESSSEVDGSGLAATQGPSKKLRVLSPQLCRAACVD